MIHIKNDHEIAIMRTGGHILANVLYEVLAAIKPGVTEIELDILAETLIKKQDGESGFKKVPGYFHTICVSTNDVVVHGIPTKRVLQEGDIIGIDCGVYYKGYHTDMSETVMVGKKKDAEIEKFLQVGKQALETSIAQVKPGNRIGHISQTIQNIVEKGGYNVVRSLIGHGVGKQLHEEPEVPGFLNIPLNKTVLLKPGMTIAVEVIYTMGKKEVKYVGGNDEWTIKTKDGKLSGLFERTVLITKTGYELLTE